MFSKINYTAMAMTMAMALGACGMDTGDAGDTAAIGKNDARLLSLQADLAIDLCEEYGWYGDGECDDFCQRADEDCDVVEAAAADHRPVCKFADTRSEGWYWSDNGGLIKYETCSREAAPRCTNISSRSEGWYGDIGLIAWDNCHRTVGVALWGETCGPAINFTCHEGTYCQGLPQGATLGGQGVCRAMGSCQTEADCRDAANLWEHPACVGAAQCLESTCSWACTVADEGVWSWTSHLVNNIESAHPYANNADGSWSITKPGASKIKVLLKLDLELGYDFVSVWGAREDEAVRYDGQADERWTEEVEGDTINLALTSDGSVTGWGFKVMSVSYFEKLAPGVCNINVDCPSGQVCNPHMCFNPFAPCHGDCQAG